MGSGCESVGFWRGVLFIILGRYLRACWPTKSGVSDDTVQYVGWGRFLQQGKAAGMGILCRAAWNFGD